MKRDFSIDSVSEDQNPAMVVEDTKLDTDYIPEDFPHRDEVIDKLWQEVFSKLLQGKEPEHFLLTGRSGTGKTAITKAMLEDVQRDNSPEVLDRFETVFINCNTKGSYKRVLQGVAEQLGVDWKDGVANDKNSNKLFRKISNMEKTVLIILDEIDFLKKNNGNDYMNQVMYTFSRPDDACPIEWKSNISLLMISNELGISGEINSDNDSGADPVVKECKRYFADEIKDILKERQEIAFKEPVLNEKALTKIAKEVKTTYDSDIRKGIKILKKVSDISHEDNEPVEIAEKAMTEYRDKYIEEVLQGSNLHELVVIKSLCSNIHNGKKKLDYINDGYRDGCERLSLEKNTNSKDQHKSKSFVYRTLDQLANNEVISKEKDHSQEQNPYVYDLKVDLERIHEKTKEKLARRGYGKVKELENTTGGSISQEQAEKEAEETIQKLTKGLDN